MQKTMDNFVRSQKGVLSTVYNETKTLKKSYLEFINKEKTRLEIVVFM